ncbi:hypothetical protein JX266_001819 [Neoarthrinium moseri]|nr:hypothetical protein JX266_001819 [Neoarthrinium moseri]
MRSENGSPVLARILIREFAYQVKGSRGLEYGSQYRHRVTIATQDKAGRSSSAADHCKTPMEPKLQQESVPGYASGLKMTAHPDRARELRCALRRAICPTSAARAQHGSVSGAKRMALKTNPILEDDVGVGSPASSARQGRMAHNTAMRLP